MTKLTKPRLRALHLIAQYPALTYLDFARVMWPDSPAWVYTPRGRRAKNAGSSGIYVTARHFLGGMIADDLIRRGWSSGREAYWLTELGARTLTERQR